MMHIGSRCLAAVGTHSIPRLTEKHSPPTLPPRVIPTLRTITSRLTLTMRIASTAVDQRPATTRVTARALRCVRHRLLRQLLLTLRRNNNLFFFHFNRALDPQHILHPRVVQDRTNGCSGADRRR